MKIIDSHIHLFTNKVIANVAKRLELVQQLKLQTDGAEERVHIAALECDMGIAGVEGALMLPTASASTVEKTNRDCIETASRYEWLMTAGTLHPKYSNNERELSYFRENHIRIIKMCSFSQGFSLLAPATLEMFETIQAANQNSDAPFSVVLDTLQKADYFFGSLPENNTTPKLLSELINRYPGINFIAAHMGGLGGSFDDMVRHLAPRANLFLDTSNAAHTLSEKEFCRLLEWHGPEHILFGTDWPWFVHTSEVQHIERLLGLAGYSEKDKAKVFCTNLLNLVEPLVKKSRQDPDLTRTLMYNPDYGGCNNLRNEKAATTSPFAAVPVVAGTRAKKSWEAGSISNRCRWRLRPRPMYSFPTGRSA